MKLIRVMLTLMLIISVPAFAQDKKLSVLDEQSLKLMAVVNGCDLDESCILSMLKELIKTDPNPMFKKYLQIADTYKPEVESNIQFCKSEQIRAYKKVMGNCLAEQMKKANVSSMTQSKIENEMQACLIKNLTPLGNANNLYAQSSLANFALQSNDSKTNQYWMAMLNGQNNSTETLTYQKCAEKLGLSIKIMNETLEAIAKENGVKLEQISDI